MRKVARGKPANYTHEIIKRRFRLTKQCVSLENKIVLDFGCGNGAQTGAFLDAKCKIIAVDIESNDLAAFAEYLHQRTTNDILPMLYDGAALPVKSGSIDLVVCYDVLEHVPDDAVALGEIYRVLKPEGEIVFSVPNKGWVFETHGAYLPLLPWNRVPFFSWLPHAIHARFAKARIYRKRDIVKLLRSHSFEILHTKYITAPMDTIRNPALKRFLHTTLFGRDTTRFTFLATGVLVHGRKI